MFDLIIKNGLIIDGTGNPAFSASIGVRAETITILRGDTSGLEAARVIDARGRVVCPGFIDFHSHSGLMIFADPKHEAKVRQGVTTEVIGVDGNSYAPFLRPEDFDRFAELNSGLDGWPELPARWSKVAEYLDLFDRKVAVNIVYLVGNSPLRIATLGWQNRPAGPKELADMRALLRECLEEGAFGLSTGLDYPPGSYAETAELIELSREVARLGGIYHTHVRYWLGDRYLDPFKEALDIGRGSGAPVHITHFYLRVGSPGGADRLLGLVEAGRKEGLDVTFDSYPYIYSSTRLLIIFPAWAHDGGPERLKAVLADPEARRKLREEVRPRAPSWQEMWLTNFRRPENHRFEGKSVAEVAEMMGKPVVDALCDLLLSENLGLNYVSAGVDGPSLPKFICHPLSMVGSDSIFLGQYPSPRTYGTFPLILGSFVREERWLRLEEAIRKMTSFPAQRLGLPDRGLLRDGFKADIVIFDPAKVSAPATRTEPKQFAQGIDYVIVNGVPVIEDGRHTGALPGRALRRGRAST
ncbi:MAG: hypothetical protein C4315_07980 [Chloroflexota bacterium]